MLYPKKFASRFRKQRQREASREWGKKKKMEFGREFA